MDKSTILWRYIMYHYNNGIEQIRVYPSIGYGSYIVQLEIPSWISSEDDARKFIDQWTKDLLKNVERWEYV